MPLKIKLSPNPPSPYPPGPPYWAGEEENNAMAQGADAGFNSGVFYEILNKAWINGDGKRQYIQNILLTSGDYSLYSPVGPKSQSGNGKDAMLCVSVSNCNVRATILTYMYHAGMLSDSFCTFLENNGYFDTYGRIVFDYRMLAKESGTTKYGNSFDRVDDTVRRIGYAPYRPYDWSKFTWEDFYGPETPIRQLELGRQFLTFLDPENGLPGIWLLLGSDGSSKNAQIAMENAMQYGPLQFGTTTHATETFYSKEQIQKYFDSYAPWNRERDLNTIPTIWAKQLFIVLKEEKPVIPYLPYFEKLPDPDKAVYAYDKDTDTMVAIDSGEAYHTFVGAYAKVKTVPKLSRPIDARKLILK